MLILCDFDGTVTVEDITNLIWDTHLRADWRDFLLPPYREGKTTPLELMAEGYSGVKATREELLALFKPRVKMRAGFQDFHAACAQRTWPFHIVSQGIDWYIREYLPSGTSIHSLTARHEGHWRVELPGHVKLKPGEDYKVYVMNRIAEDHPGEERVFIGDGRNDFQIAKAADRVFALKGSTLERLCRESAVKHTSFATFHDVLHAFEG